MSKATSPSAVGSRARKNEQRAADANPVKPLLVKERPPVAGASTRLDKVTGKTKKPTRPKYAADFADQSED